MVRILSILLLSLGFLTYALPSQALYGEDSLILFCPTQPCVAADGTVICRDPIEAPCPVVPMDQPLPEKPYRLTWSIPKPISERWDRSCVWMSGVKKKVDDWICVCPALERCYHFIPMMFRDSICDYSIHYGAENLAYTGSALLIGGLLANTRIDREIHRSIQHKVRSHGSDNFFKPFEPIGKFMYLRIYIWTLVLGNALNFQQSYVGQQIFEWAYRSFRSMLLVSPQITMLRKVLGGGRYGARHYKDSRWRLLKKGRASCSGHTFNGALPLLTISAMSDNPLYRYGFFALSFLPALSRLNDDQHYFSQVFLGWTLAYLSVRTVDIAIRDKRQESLCVQVVPVEDGAMLRAQINW